MKRILAWLGLLLIAAALAALIFLAVTGAPAGQILAVLFVLFAVPVILYAFFLAAKLFHDKRDP